MPFSPFAQAQVLSFYFQGLTPGPPVPIYIALHSASPDGGSQATAETVYAGYARMGAAPSPSTFLVSSGPPARAQNLVAIAFPACSGSGDTVAFWSVGLSGSGPGQLITSGPIGPGTAYGFTADVGAPLFVPLLPPGTVPGQAVTLYQAGPGALLPGGLVAGQVYYVNAIAGGELVLGLTPSGPTVLPQTAGSGYLCPVTPLVVAQGTVPTFPPNSLLTFLG
jgi:hypothetical protein